MFLMALVLISCYLKQIIKGNIVSTHWTSTTQSNSKICQTILNKTDKSTRKMEQGLRATFPKRSNFNYNI